MVEPATAAVYAGLFFSSFLAATVLPLGSEAVVVGMAAGGYAPAAIFAAATLGNTLGAVFNYGAGRLGEQAVHRRFAAEDLPVLEKARRIVRRWGAPAMLLAWLPVIGDPLTLLAGLAGMPFWRFCFWTGLGKGLRYLALLTAADWALK